MSYCLDKLNMNRAIACNHLYRYGISKSNLPELEKEIGIVIILYIEKFVN